MFDIGLIIKKKIPNFCQKHPKLSDVLINVARCIVRDKEFQIFRKNHSNRDGLKLIDDIYSFLNFSAHFHASDIEKIPATGRVIIVLNHPTTLDGLSLIKLLSPVRRDVKAIVNELFESTGALTDYIIPVSISGSGISKSSMQAIQQHLSDEGLLIIFPAGSPSRIYDGAIQDAPWSSSFLKMAKRYNSPILPIYIDSRMSYWFYFWSKVCFPISMLLPFREVFHLRDKIQTFYVGNIISADNTAEMDQFDLAEIRRQLYSLSPRSERYRL